MKTAIVLPDNVLSAVSQLAATTHKTANEVIHEAVAEYLDRHAPEQVTAAMDAVVAKLEQPLDRFVQTAARRAMERTEW